MRFACLTILVVALVVTFCGEPKHPTVKGTITFADGGRPDSVFVGLYNLYFSEQLGEPLYFTSTKNAEFAFETESDEFAIAVWALGYECYRGAILVHDRKSPITVNVTLQRKGIPAEFANVYVVGDYNGWDYGKSTPLSRTGDVWKLADNSILKNGQFYKFRLDSLNRYSLSSDSLVVIKEYATFNNVFMGEEIVFDPAQYQQPTVNSTADIAGFDRLDKFIAASNDARYYQDHLIEYYSKLAGTSAKEHEQWFNKYIRNRIDSLAARHDDYFKPMFTELYLRRSYNHHPAIKELLDIYRQGQGEVDTNAVNLYLQSEKFLDYYAETLELLKSIPPESFIIHGDFVFNIQMLQKYATKPRIAEKFGVSKNYFYDFIVNFVKKSPKLNVCADLLFQMASNYARDGDAEKATFLINWLKSDYADRFYVGEGHADAVLSSLLVTEGKPAPPFVVKPLGSDSLRLSDLRGKFVFIDFWGSWCGPCLGELPNLRHLAQAIPGDKLQIVGLVQDDSTRLVNFLAKEPLPYPNALAGKELLTSYGINAFPTTILIGPDGVVLAKDLRGEKLVELVSKKMEEYKGGI